MVLLSLILVSIVLFIIIYSFFNRYRYFSSRSIPSPPISSIIYGHITDLWSVKCYSEQLRHWTSKYGSIYGIFEGTRPVYVVSDVQFLEEILIKQFSRFHCRRTTLANRTLGKQYLNVLSANISHLWKKQRKILTPTFSGAKMRRLLPTAKTCVKIFMQRLSCIENRINFNIYEFYKRLTMDVICRCAFGIDTEVQYDLNNTNIYMRKIEELFSKDLERTFLGKLHRTISHTKLGNLCSFLLRLKQSFQSKQSAIPAQLWLVGHMHEFIQQRYTHINHQPNQSNDDLLQLMIDSIHSDKDQLSPTELLSNVFIFLIAGYETTSTTLAYCTYRLSMHQDIQQKLYEEIIQYSSSDTDYYDIIMTKLTYMDAFIREVLRMHPVAIQVVNRQCIQDTDVLGYDIQKGSLIQVDVLSVHFNQELWGPQPVEQFDPERHFSKRHPLAFLAFGAGPRTCIGMRFALMEIKSCLVRLISEYRILPSSDETHQLNVGEVIVMAPEKLFVKIEKRIDQETA